LPDCDTTEISRGYAKERAATMMSKETSEALANIRSAMHSALSAKPKRIAEYKRLAAEHRKILHAALPVVKEQWERCVAASS
jgi:hypothetical protein